MKNPLTAVRTIARAARAGRPSGIVLLYHRVVELEADPQRLAITPARFAEHLELLSTRYRPMTLRKMVEHARGGALPDGAVAVTLDDGYADVFENARPLLDRYGIPATIFLTTSHLGSDREFWWDDLERLLLLPGNLASALHVDIAGTAYEWELNGSSSYTAAQQQLHSGWNVSAATDPTARHRVYRQLHRLLRTAPAAAREAALAALAGAAAASRHGRATHRVLSPEEVVFLANDDLISVGAHTATHPTLAAIPSADQRTEIVESKVQLQALIDREVVAFAYPFGGSRDYTSETAALVRESGFTSAYCTTAGAVGPRSDPFELPRIAAGHLDAECLHQTLQEWM